MNFFERITFTSYKQLLLIILMTVFLYFLMVILFRISGKRSMSEVNSFDFLFTIIIGSLVQAPFFPEIRNF